MKTTLIIGASHAAVEVIASLRKKSWPGKIILVGDEASLPYQRPPLSKGYYQGNTDKLEIKPAQFYTDAEVELHLGCKVTHINRNDKNIVLDNGNTLHYDKLIIATGTRARQLPIAGADLPGIYYLRRKADVDAIKQHASPGQKLLIIGAGYIGLELAASAIKLGLEVTVLESTQRVLARVTSPVVSAFYQNLHANQGVDIRLGVTLEKLLDDQHGKRAILSNGDSIDFNCAVIGIGVIPNSELAEAAGLTCDNGILVDEFTRTNDDDIYAIGDCSQHPSRLYQRHIRLESVPNALAQAKTAAADISGAAVPYDEVPWFWSDQYAVKLQTAGLFVGYDTALVRGEVQSQKFSVFYLQQGKLIAVDAINSPAEFMLAKKWIAAQATPDPSKIVDTRVPAKNLATP